MSRATPSFTRSALSVAAVVPLVAVGLTTHASGATASATTEQAKSTAAVGRSGTGPTRGLLPRSKLTVGSVVKVDLANQFVRLPLHRGEFNGKSVWYILTDASEQGAADQLGLNFAPKLGNLSIGCAACVQEVTLKAPLSNVFGGKVQAHP